MSDKKIPKIRFPEFTGDWEQRKLGNSLVLLKDGTHGTHADANDGPLLLSAKNIKEGTIKWDETDRRISQDEYEKIHSKFNLESGDVLLTIVGSIGETAVLRDVEGLTFQRSVAFLRPNDDIISEFLYSEIQSERFQKELESRKSTSAQPGIYLGDLAEIPLYFSSTIDEQKKIGDFFTNLDNLITLHQRKCEKIKEYKKGCLQKMFPKEGEAVPEVRFPEFTGDWEQRKFASVFDGLQNNTLSRAELNYESGTVRNVHYGDVLIKFGDYIDASETKLPYISDDAKVDKYKNSFLQDGDIIIADTAEDDTVGKCTEIQGSEGLKLLSGLHTIACRPKEEYGPMFLGYYINSPAYHSQLKPLMQGIKVTSISKSALQDTDMIMPKSIEEQTKIGEYFSNLDNLITLHQRECEKYKELKKGLLQQMFV